MGEDREKFKTSDVGSKKLDNTAVPLPFEIYTALKAVKYNEVEKLIHKIIDRLTDLRTRQNREFFNVSPGVALSILKDIATALDDAEYSGSLLILLQEMISFINRNNHKAWKKLPTSRQKMPDYPDRAITETRVNALIHRDYLEYGSEVHVDMYDDCLKIYSSGGMLDGSLVQNLDPMNITSKRRNPVIADIFSRLKLMERRVSGFKKIMENYHAYSASEEQRPKFRSDVHDFFIVLPNLNYGQEGVEDMEDNDSEKNVTKDVTKRREAIIAMMTFNNTITVDEIADSLHVNRRTVLRDIDYLRERNKIKRIGGRKEGCWEIM